LVQVGQLEKLGADHAVVQRRGLLAREQGRQKQKKRGKKDFHGQSWYSIHESVVQLLCLRYFGRKKFAAGHGITIAGLIRMPGKGHH
jgi:hypothetical protein